MQPKRLGKGLDSLLADLSVENNSLVKQQVLELAIDKVKPNPDQPRKAFDDSALDELSGSIQALGVIQPILVQEMGDGTYQIIAGERRYRASLKAGKSTIPAIIRVYGGEEKLEVALVENLQRQDLNPLEEALAFRALMDNFNLSQDEISQRLGKNRSTIANSLRLLKLPPEIQTALKNGELTAGHARAILAVEEDKRLSFFHDILKNGLSVRAAEAATKESEVVKTESTAVVDVLGISKGATIVSTGKDKPETSFASKRSPELWEFEKKLIQALGTKVQIKGDVKSGRIEIGYYSLEDLERIFELIAKVPNV